MSRVDTATAVQRTEHSGIQEADCGQGPAPHVQFQLPGEAINLSFSRTTQSNQGRVCTSLLITLNVSKSPEPGAQGCRLVGPDGQCKDSINQTASRSERANMDAFCVLDAPGYSARLERWETPGNGSMTINGFAKLNCFSVVDQ